MRALFLFLAAFLAASQPTRAEPSPVVIELYTSQGCSSCPPADKTLASAAKWPGVIALGLHVDYWDYLGWKDTFANSSYSERQRGYARAVNSPTVYTPQMVINGVDHVVGSREAEVKRLVDNHRGGTAPVKITMSRGDSGSVVELSSNGAVNGVLEVHLVRYHREKSVSVKRGENGGRTLSYSNIVYDWDSLGMWDSSEPGRFTAEMQDDGNPAVIIVQAPNHGRIVAAKVF